MHRLSPIVQIIPQVLLNPFRNVVYVVRTSNQFEEIDFIDSCGKMVKGLLVVLLMLCTLAVSAQENQPIFEIPLGRTLERPFTPCDAPQVDRNNWCSKFGDSSRLPREIFLNRPYFETPLKIPTWITGGTATVNLDAEGKVARISVSTTGSSSQSRVIESIEGRFGKPTLLEEREAKNAYGASWNVKKVEWVLPSVYIYYNCFRRDECTLKLETPEEYERQKAKATERQQKDRM